MQEHRRWLALLHPPRALEPEHDVLSRTHLQVPQRVGPAGRVRVGEQRALGGTVGLQRGQRHCKDNSRRTDSKDLSLCGSTRYLNSSRLPVETGDHRAGADLDQLRFQTVGESLHHLAVAAGQTRDMPGVLLLGRLIVSQRSSPKALEVCGMKALEVSGHGLELIRLELPCALPDQLSHGYVTPIRVAAQEQIHQALHIRKVSAPSLVGSLMPLRDLLESKSGAVDELEKRLGPPLQELRAQFDRMAGGLIQDGMNPAAQPAPSLEQDDAPSRLRQSAGGSEASHSATHHDDIAGQSVWATRIGGPRWGRAGTPAEPATARKRDPRQR